MTVKTHPQPHVPAEDPAAPPFQPDPAIMGNAEGNAKILKHDREAAQKFLDQERDEVAPRG